MRNNHKYLLLFCVIFFSFTKVFSQNISSAFVSAPILCYGGFALDSMRININQTPTPTQYKCLVGYHMNNTATPNTGVDYFLSYLSTQNTTASQLNFNGFLPNFLSGVNAGQTINYFVRIVDSTTYYPAHTFGNGASMVGVIDQFGPINFTEPNQLIVTLLSTDIANCSGLDDGTANASTSGGTPFAVGSPYDLLWIPGGQTTQAVVGLSAGAYTCTAVDANGCTSSSTTIVNAPLYGCTDPLAYNYDPLPTCDDGSCIAVVNGCTDPLAFNYDPTANTDDGSCIAIVNGCTDPTACNYDPNANTDDGSCLTDYGCTDPLAFNYDPLATCDDGSCIAIANGCTDSTASNYNVLANVDDGSCTYCNNDTSYTNITTCDNIIWNGVSYDSSGTYIITSVSNNNYSLNLDGNDYIDLVTSPNYGPSSNSEFSFSVWIKPNALGGFVISQYDNLNSGNSNFFLRVDQNGSFQVSGDGTNSFFFGNVAFGQWQYVTILIESSGLTHAYVNGSLESIGNLNLNSNYGSQILTLGRVYGSPATINYDGVIDDVSLWDYLLDTNEIQQYMMCSPFGIEPGLVGYWNFEEGSGNTVYDLTSNGNNGTINGAIYDAIIPPQSCNLINANGCDSVAVLNLIINQSNTSFTSITACDSYLWNGQSYTSSGNYNHIIYALSSDTVSSLTYCASNPAPMFSSLSSTIIEEVQLIGDNSNITNNTTGSNDSYQDYTSVMYSDITEGQIYTVNVMPNDLSVVTGSYAPQAINVYIDFNIDGDFVDLGEDLGVINIPWGTWVPGTVYSFSITVPTTGVYGATRMRVVCMSNANGALITMGPCESATGSNPPWFGATEDYSIVLNSPLLPSCDSVAMLDLTINNSTAGSSSVTACDTYTWEGQTVIISDVLSHTYVAGNAIGCDSTHILTVVINNSTSVVVADTACGEYLFGANLLDSSGTYIDTFLTSYNCDSIVTLELTIYEDSSVTYITACDSAEWNGVWYYISDTITTIGLLTTIPVSSGGNLWSLYYEEDGESGLGAEWNTSSIVNHNGSNLLGSFGNTSIQLSLNNLPPHDDIRVEFDLFISDSWDGNHSPGPDYWNLDVDGNQIIRTTFTNHTTQDQSFPSDYYASYPLWTNASQNGLNGFFGCCNSSIYAISRDMIHNSSNINISFSADNLQSLNDESWGIDNIKVYFLASDIYCDSVATAIIDIKNSSSSYTNITACDSYTWALNGQTYYTSQIDTIQSTNIDGCQHIDSLELVIYPEINLTAIITDESCVNYSDGSIVLSATGGLGTFSYNWSGPGSFSETDQDIFNLGPGTYNLTITDVMSSCTKDTSFVIDSGFDMQVIISQNDISCYDANDGSIDIIPINLINPIYLWSDISSSLEDRTNMSPGLYYLQIDDNNCFVRDTFVFNQPDSLFIIAQQTPSVCVNGNSGEISVQAFGGTPSYSYFWSNWAGNSSVNSNLSPGVYDLDVYDNNGCLLEESFTISSYQLTVSSNIDHIDCYGDSTGSIDVTVSGGFFPYVYLWSDGTATEDIYNLSEGSVSCSIIDYLGCEISEFFIINEEMPIQTIVSINSVSCYGGNDGSASLNISGGVNPYNIDWYNIDENNLFEGTYLYEITDDNGCTFQDSIYVPQEDSLDITINVIDLNCTGNPEGEISISISSGGVPPYVFSWMGPNSFTSSQEDIDNLYAGLYMLTLEDANGCVSEFQITVGEPTELSHYINVEQSNYSTYNISCHDGNDGWISVAPSGGYIPYTYLWSTGSTSSSITDLVAGTYNLTITNGIGCQETFVLNINEPSELLSAIPTSLNNYNGYDISCFGGSDGAIIVETSGGVSPYSYFWNNQIGFNPNISLSAGIYNLEVIDNNNCSYFEAIILDEPEILTWVVDIFPDTCEKGVGKVDILLTGGIAPYSYLWNYFENLPVAIEVVQGEYSIEFTDANSCTAYDTIYVDNLIGPDIDFVIYPDYERLYQQLDDPIVYIDKTELVWQNVNSWVWDFGDSSYGYDSIVYHSYQDVGTYFVTLTIETDYGCIDTLTKEVVIAEYDLFIPNAFTPNLEDNINEGFRPHGIGIDEFLMNIYTRWGEKVFSTNDIEDFWNGKYNNTSEDCQLGVYIYYIQVEDVFGAIHKYEGQVNLIR